MFFFNNKKEVIVKIRDEWGRLQIFIKQPSSRLTDDELAEQLQCSLATVKRERKD